MLEFQAVVLAGYGQRLYHLVDRVPKALLPVANTPVIEYVLQWLENAGISSIFIVSTPEAGPQISRYLAKVYESQTLGAHIELLTPEAYGTVDALCAIKDKISTDFFVVPCDVLTDYPLERMMDSFRLGDPSIISLLCPVARHEYVGAGFKEQGDVLFVGLDDGNERVVLVETKDSISGGAEDPYSQVAVHMPILDAYGSVNLYSNLQDPHVYLMKRWILDWMSSIRGDITSLKDELIPLLVKCQFSRALADKMRVSQFCKNTRSHNVNFSRASEDDLLEFARKSVGGNNVKSSSIESPPSRLQSPVVRFSDVEAAASFVVCKADVYLSNDDVVTVSTTASKYCIRVNTIPAYFDMNRQVMGRSPRMTSNADVSSAAQVGPDSMVGEGTLVGERCSVKKSVIGSHCTIGKNVKISNSVIMDYVVIEDGVKLEGCILSSGANIRTKSNLRACEVGSKFVVPASTDAKGERLTESRTISADEDGF